jgi:anthranilate phosphoribosyltransferase
MDKKQVLEKLMNKKDLTYDEAYETMDLIMKGELEQAYVAAILTALRMKGETVT